MRLLVVEDETAIREQLADFLGSLGFAVDVAEDGRVGLFNPYLKSDAKMHLVRYSGSDPHFKIRHHNILSPRYLELIGENMPQPLNRLSMIQLVSAIGFGNIEQSSMFLPEMLPNVSEYLLRFSI